MIGRCCVHDLAASVAPTPSGLGKLELIHLINRLDRLRSWRFGIINDRGCNASGRRLLLSLIAFGSRFATFTDRMVLIRAIVIITRIIVMIVLTFALRGPVIIIIITR